MSQVKWDLSDIDDAIIRLVPLEDGPISVYEDGFWWIHVIVKRYNGKKLRLSKKKTCLWGLTYDEYEAVFNCFDIDEIDISDPELGSDMHIFWDEGKLRLMVCGESTFLAPANPNNVYPPTARPHPQE